MEEKNCPLCGKIVQEGKTFCEDCLQIAKDENPEDFYAKEDDETLIVEKEPTIEQELSVEKRDEEEKPEAIVETEEEKEEEKDIDSEETPTKSLKKTKLFFFIGIVLIVIIGAISTYLVREKRASEEADIALWNTCIDQNTPVAYSTYLLRYPDGLFQEEAQKKILELRNLEKKRWETAQKSNDANILSAYLIDYPNSPYERDARLRIDSLSWVSAVRQNTAESYLAYLENMNLGHFGGRYQNQAKDKYDYLSQLKTLEGDELKKVSDDIANVLKLLSTKNYLNVQKRLAPTVKFFGEEKSSKDIMALFKKEVTEQKAKNIIYLLQDNSLEVIKDNRGLYFITLTIEKRISFKARKKKDETSRIALKLELSKEKIVQLINKK